MTEEEKEAIDYLQFCYDISVIEKESLPKLGITLNLIDKLQKENEVLKNTNRNLSIENQSLFESINIGDDTSLAHRLKEQKEAINKLINFIAVREGVDYEEVKEKFNI